MEMRVNSKVPGPSREPESLVMEDTVPLHGCLVFLFQRQGKLQQHLLLLRVLTERHGAHIVVATCPSILLNTSIYKESSDALDTAWWAWGGPCCGGTIRGSLAPSPVSLTSCRSPRWVRRAAIVSRDSHSERGLTLQERAAQNMCRWFDPGSAAREAL